MRSNARVRHRLAASVRRIISSPAPRPLALVGRSGCGKTRVLRAAFDDADAQPTWTTARAVAETIVDAIRREAHGEAFTALAGDPRPLVIEHLEDLRGMPRTLEESRLLVAERTRRGLLVFLTLTSRPGSDDVAHWLARHTEVVAPTA